MVNRDGGIGRCSLSGDKGGENSATDCKELHDIVKRLIEVARYTRQDSDVQSSAQAPFINCGGLGAYPQSKIGHDATTESVAWFRSVGGSLIS